VVAGRHVQALKFLDILLGDTPALTMPQRFYQRALAGDADEIITAARLFLKRKSFAAYCDKVLMPALLLARSDLLAGNIGLEQQFKVRMAIVRVLEVQGGEAILGSRRRARQRVSVLDNANIGLQLRHQRENVSGRWQGPLTVPAASVVLCIGLGSPGDDLATEILVRILRGLKIDARHLSLDDLAAEPPPGSTLESVAIVCIVSAEPSKEDEHAAVVVQEVRRRFTATHLLAVLLPELQVATQASLGSNPASEVNQVLHSFEETVDHCLAWYQRRA
jgi:hypothetical protein